MDISCRHICAPSRATPSPGALNQWFLVQERDKEEKYKDECARHRVKLTPFIMHLWGGVGPQGRKVVDQMLKLVLGHSTGWTRTQKAIEFHQRLSLTIMRMVGRQLHSLASAGMTWLEETYTLQVRGLTAAPFTHSPYSVQHGLE